jgi:hypothetical protein
MIEFLNNTVLHHRKPERMCLKIVKKIVVLHIIAVMVSFLAYMIPIRKPINTTIQGIQYRIGDIEYAENVAVCKMVGKHLFCSELQEISHPCL